jgi:Ca2+-transporting ATPase
LYVPFLERAIGTRGLSTREWLLVVGLAATITPVLEVGKWMVRRGWFRGVVERTRRA